MYKLLLSWRYLRTRYIALASIISVTLGVGTLIVVNSVMAGFAHEMHVRLHGILADIIFEGHSLDGFADPRGHVEEIKKVAGDDLVAITYAVHVPAMINIKVREQWLTKQVNLIGVDEATYANVSDFREYLIHPDNQRQLSFLLREDGYSSSEHKLPPSGWQYRRLRAQYEREFEAHQRELQQAVLASYEEEAPAATAGPPTSTEVPPPDASSSPGPLPPDLNTPLAESSSALPAPSSELPSAPQDPFNQHRPAAETFDPAKDQYAGIVLGIAIGSIRQRDAKGEVQDYFLCRPGDDVRVTFPTAGQPPKAASEHCTVVDFYESKMSEYDSGFAFVPLSWLQEKRVMGDAVTTIQLKLKPGTDLVAVRDKLRARFPAEEFPYRIQTWRDMQGPLLAAVQMETTLLNILLFLIIAVAGFGILATFFMIVVEKTRDIGILKALGAPSGGVMSIFLGYGLSLGIVGSGVGLVGGLLFVYYINGIAKLVELVTGQEVFDPTVYYFQKIPTIVEPQTVIGVAIGAMLIAVAASVLPALRAARLHPVEALRYE